MLLQRSLPSLFPFFCSSAGFNFMRLAYSSAHYSCLIQVLSMTTPKRCKIMKWLYATTGVSAHLSQFSTRSRQCGQYVEGLVTFSGPEAIFIGHYFQAEYLSYNCIFMTQVLKSRLTRNIIFLEVKRLAPRYHSGISSIYLGALAFQLMPESLTFAL